MASTERKLKTLRVLQLLLEWSDPEHPLTAEEIISLLGKYDLDADRRSIYSDIAVINQLDPSTLEIEKAPGNHGQYVSKRMFELSELKLLIDAVQVAKFIPPAESRTLIKKLGSLASVHQSKDLRREIHLCDPPVGDNQVLNSVDVIHTAMNDNHRIEFQYNEWTPRKTKQLRRNGMVYQVSPWKLLWDNEYYYLLAYDPSIQDIKHYRVDRMVNAKVSPLQREGYTIYQNYKTGFSTRTFGMYGGEDVKVKLKCSNKLVGVILDRFGADAMLIPEDNNYFSLRVLVTLSPQFYGWVASLGDSVEILEPQSIREEYTTYLYNILKNYD